jgi:hypothetical protein
VRNGKKKRFPKSVAWQVDHDYKHKLSKSEQEWLADFDDNYHGADFRDKPDGWSDDDKRERYVAKNAANRDLYTHGLPEDMDHAYQIPAPLEVTTTHTPDYQDSWFYKSLVARLREAINDGDKAAAVSYRLQIATFVKKAEDTAVQRCTDDTKTTQVKNKT